MAENKYRKRFEDDYKRKIVRLVDELGKSPTQVAQDIGAPRKLLGVGLENLANRAQTHSQARVSFIQLMTNCDSR